MQTEIAVEIHHPVRSAGLWHRYARPSFVVGTISVGHDHVEPVDSAALENANERLAGVCRTAGASHRERRAGQEDRIQAEAHERQAAAFDKNSPIYRLIFHTSSLRYCRWNSGLPSA